VDRLPLDHVARQVHCAQLDGDPGGSAFTTGILLICDAWFDVMTAAPDDRWLSIVTAVVGELPLAVLLITGALRILRLTATRLYVLDRGVPLWRIPLLP
jgi:hypothetical protein